ncbi:hypothetical protein STENM327S_00602 [Streptomyces tendae]
MLDRPEQRVQAGEGGPGLAPCGLYRQRGEIGRRRGDVVEKCGLADARLTPRAPGRHPCHGGLRSSTSVTAAISACRPTSGAGAPVALHRVPSAVTIFRPQKSVPYRPRPAGSSDAPTRTPTPCTSAMPVSPARILMSASSGPCCGSATPPSRVPFGGADLTVNGVRMLSGLPQVLLGPQTTGPSTLTDGPAAAGRVGTRSSIADDELAHRARRTAATARAAYGRGARRGRTPRSAPRGEAPVAVVMATPPNQGGRP